MRGYGRFIASQRALHNHTQDQLARMLDVSRGTIANWEHERRMLPIDTAIRICDIYKVTLDQLFGRSEVGCTTASTSPRRPRSASTR